MVSGMFAENVLEATVTEIFYTSVAQFDGKLDLTNSADYLPCNYLAWQ